MTSSHAEPVTDLEWVLWAGTLGLDSPIAARVEAAQVGGFGRISLSPLDVRGSEAEGTEAKALGRLFRDAGLSVVIDPVMSWTEGPLPPSGLASVGVEEILRMAEAIGAESIGAIGPVGGVEVDALIAPFATLCDRASGIGALVHLEFMPMLAVGDLSSAWTVVSGAGRSNGGLLFDTWHFFRGRPDFATLARVPGDRIFGVQVADAPAEPAGSLGEETFHRLLPGEGDLDLVGVLSALDRIGGLRSIGPEVISPVTAALPATEVARAARDLIAGLIVRARSAGHDASDDRG